MNSLRKNCSSVKQKEENQHLQPQSQPQPPAVIPLLQQEQPFFYNHHRGGARPIDCGERLSNQKEEGWMMVEREHMFDKVVTPSDVGKLNRLVIPKQHAERYFPLDSSTNYKGLLLNFEDSDGKLWRFQYSYWNSSQSYVMTKGWSRFVKEKKLDAGDVVSFQRGVGVTAKDRLFIDWRRRVNPSGPPPDHLSFVFHNRNLIHNYSPLVLQSLPAWRNPNRNPNFMLQAPYMNPNIPTSSRSVYFGPGLGLGLGLGFDPPQQQLKLDLPAPPAAASAKVVSGKRLRLFGVNMDCEFSKDEDDRYYDHPSEPNDPNHLIPSSSSYSIPTIPYLPLTPFERETECSKISMLSTSSAHDFNIIANSTASGVSLDLKM